MQCKLATWSTENKERKFDRLLRLIADRGWLKEAARVTLASRGARTPGVDGVDRGMMEANLQHELTTIRDELLAGSYSPLPARRVYIPKANGKLRPLGIPSLRDRIVQRAMLMDGADMGKRFPPGFVWLQTGPQRTPRDSHGETSVARRR